MSEELLNLNSEIPVPSEEVKLEVKEEPKLTPEQQEQKQEQQLSFMFDLYASRLIPIIDKLSNKSLRRVLKSAILVPVWDKYTPNLKNEDEKAAYQLCEHLLPIKMIFIEKAMLKWQHEESLKQTNEGENNGKDDKNNDKS